MRGGDSDAQMVGEPMEILCTTVPRTLVKFLGFLLLLHVKVKRLFQGFDIFKKKSTNCNEY